MVSVGVPDRLNFKVAPPWTDTDFAIAAASTVMVCPGTMVTASADVGTWAGDHFVESDQLPVAALWMATAQAAEGAKKANKRAISFMSSLSYASF
jgi:hypothetical protein